jgi:hypothetical protein
MRFSRAGAGACFSLMLPGKREKTAAKAAIALDPAAKRLLFSIASENTSHLARAKYGEINRSIIGADQGDNRARNRETGRRENRV